MSTNAAKMTTMRSRTVTAFGRTWCHQQFHGLITALIDNDRDVAFCAGQNGTAICRIDYGDSVACVFGKTLWLALAVAVEKMEGDGHE